MGLNDKITDQFIEHEVNLLRLQEHQRQKILKELKALEADLIRKLQAFPQRQTFTQARQKALLRQVQASIQTAYGKIVQVHSKDLQDMVQYEAEHISSAINRAADASVMSVGVSQDVLEAMTDDNVVFGAPVRRYWEQEAGALQQSFISQMRQGILAGETPDQLVRRVRGTAANNFKDGIMNPRERNVEMRVRTAANSILNDARMEVYRANQDVLRGVQAQVTLDDRTSEICMARSGFAWDFEGRPLNEATDEDFPGPPPWHPNCRTTLIGITKSVGEILGDPEIDKEIQKEVAKLPPKTQASMDGQVPKELTYEEWLRGKGETFQKKVLGPGKWQLWNDGKISLKDLVDQRGNPLTLDELKKISGDGRDDGGLSGGPVEPPPVGPRGTPTDFTPNPPPEEFIEARDVPTPYSSFLSPLKKEDLQGKFTYLSPDKRAGFLLDDQGDFGNLFNNGGPKGIGRQAIIQGIQDGALTLDAYDGYLPHLYSQYGYRVTGRMKFVDEFAPPNWNFARDGRPDVVFMAYEGGARGTIANRIGKFPAYIPKSGRYYTDYDQAKSESRRAALARTTDRGARRKGSLGDVAESGGTAPVREESLDAITAEPLTAPSAAYSKFNPAGRDTLEQFTTKQGLFTDERQVLHKAIRNEVIRKEMTPVAKPVSYILGGGPASGKSTVLDKGLVKTPTNLVKIDADGIKGMLPEYKEMVKAGDDTAAAYVHEESSKLSKVYMQEAVDASYNVLLDGTGDGDIDGLTKKVTVLRSGGRKVVANYVTVSSETAVARAYARAKRSGRAVPIDQIVGIHRAVSTVVPKAIQRGLFDEFNLWDNTGKTPILIAEAQGTKLTVHRKDLWDDFLAKADAPVTLPEAVNETIVEQAHAATRRTAYTYDIDASAKLAASDHYSAGATTQALKDNKDLVTKTARTILGDTAATEKSARAAFGEIFNYGEVPDTIKPKRSWLDQFRETVGGHWNVTSGDRNQAAIVMQIAASEFFRMPTAALSHMPLLQREKALALYKKHKKVVDAVFLAQYRATQTYLKNHGIREVTVFRGMSGLDRKLYPANGTLRDLTFQHQPLSSFSVDQGVAAEFGDTVISEVVPASHIFAIPAAGFGTFAEREVVVLGFNRQGKFVRRTVGDKNYLKYVRQFNKKKVTYD